MCAFNRRRIKNKFLVLNLNQSLNTLSTRTMQHLKKITLYSMANVTVMIVYTFFFFLIAAVTRYGGETVSNMSESIVPTVYDLIISTKMRR